MTTPQHAESEAAALRRFNPTRFPWREVAWWQSAVFAAGWFLTWLGGLGFVLLGAAMSNKAVVWFGAASLLLIGPGLLWFSERFTMGIPTTEDTPVDQRSTPNPQDLAQDGLAAPSSRKTKPKPRQ